MVVGIVISTGHPLNWGKVCCKSSDLRRFGISSNSQIEMNLHSQSCSFLLSVIKEDGLSKKKKSLCSSSYLLIKTICPNRPLKIMVSDFFFSIFSILTQRLSWRLAQNWQDIPSFGAKSLKSKMRSYRLCEMY